MEIDSEKGNTTLNVLFHTFSWYFFSILFPHILNFLKSEELYFIDALLISSTVLSIPFLYYLSQNWKKCFEYLKSPHSFNSSVLFISFCHSMNLFLVICGTLFLGASQTYVYKSLEVVCVSIVSSFVFKLEVFTLQTNIAILMNFTGVLVSVIADEKISTGDDQETLHYIFGHMAGIGAVLATMFRNVFIYKDDTEDVPLFLFLGFAFYIFPSTLVSLYLSETSDNQLLRHWWTLIGEHWLILFGLSISHFLYNISSIKILHMVKPTYHSILKCGKRIIILLTVSSYSPMKVIGLSLIICSILIAKWSSFKRAIISFIDQSN